MLNFCFEFFSRVDVRCLNEICCKVYNNHRVMEFDEGRRRAVVSLQVGDKIMATKNKDVSVFKNEEEEEEEGKEEEKKKKKEGPRVSKERLMNGSVYAIKEVIISLEFFLKRSEFKLYYSGSLGKGRAREAGRKGRWPGPPSSAFQLERRRAAAGH